VADGRVDHQLSSRDTLFYRYSIDWADMVIPDTFDKNIGGTKQVSPATTPWGRNMVARGHTRSRQRLSVTSGMDTPVQHGTAADDVDESDLVAYSRTRHHGSYQLRRRLSAPRAMRAWAMQVHAG